MLMPPDPLRIAIIGAGVRGRDFAAACARAGHQVTLEDVMPAKLRHAGELFASLGQTVELVSSVEDAVPSADLAIDFVPDELESKLEIFSLLDRMAPPRTILCTPSETLSITDLASCTYRADRCIMLRGLPAPADRASIPRILVARGTSESTQATTLRLLQSLGHQAALEPDLPMLMKNMGLSPNSRL
jgi:3-hydroxybutyryl-CoA dehydrogenase